MSQHKNFVSLKDETIRMFENPILDWMSRIHWVTPLIVWVPVVLYCFYQASIVYQFGWIKIPVLFLIGLFIWTLSEYFVHRFVFHYHPSTDFGKRISFLMHGVHHDYPNDSKRLVMPPIMSIVLAIPFFVFFNMAFGGGGATYSAFAGMVCGYLVYDMMHYALHHAKWQNPYFEKLKKHHMAHHYVHPEAGFGVSNMFWDMVFGTELEEARKKANEE